ncbi:MAG: GtrA family protein [Firmicutes bacterium]|nr:GtrA family protein [Bacillota bacterium]
MMFDCLLKLRDIQFIKFLFVGVINTAFGYSLFALFIYLGVHYSIAVLFSTILGILFNFKTTGVMVFNSRDNSLIGRFFLVYTILYIVNIALLTILANLKFNMYLAGALLLLPLALMSFVLNKKFVFRR